ncbi:MAG: carotenoid biosynthesis protein [Raineya sp.]|jgi:putative membrane protein|nr:carotenoid biosynthesis protein [Raineya sp.]
MNNTTAKQKNQLIQELLKEKNVIYLLIAMHIAGIIGLALPETRNIFKLLVPFNLITNALLILYFQKQWNKYLIGALLIIMFTGFGIEVAGVHTGLIFGNYWYKTTLGYKVLEVPLLIAINWLIVIYTTSACVAEIKISKIFKALLATCLTVGLDFFIEPIAMKLDFWDWQNGIIPLQNYIGWFITAFFLHLIVIFLPFEKKNKVAVVLYICELIFFLVLGFLL